MIVLMEGHVSQADPLDERLLSQAALNSASDVLRSLCVKFSPTFVAVERRDARLDECLESLLSKLNDAGFGAAQAEKRLEIGIDSDDTSSLSALAERHRLRRRTLLQHGSLLELLELPALMDACLRAGLYDEALAVAAFGNALERRHSMQHSSQHAEESRKEKTHQVRQGGEDVILSVVSSLRSRENDLRHHLLSRLRGSITMPHCLEIVTALRRLNGVELERKRTRATLRQSFVPNRLVEEISHNEKTQEVLPKEMDIEQAHSAMEMRLMVDFFEARDSWLRDSSSIGLNDLAAGAGAQDRDRNACSDAGSGNSLDCELLLNTIDRIRTRTFEVATQFLAIFCGTSSSQMQTSLQRQPFTLLSMWLSRRVQHFLHSLESQLAFVNNAATLRDVLDASNFFASSMGRVGADFQCLLPPMFEDRIASIVMRRWSNGVKSLDVTLKVCREAGLAGPLSSTATTSVGRSIEDDNGEHGADAGAEDDAVDIGTPLPPRRTLASPPLARFINAFLDGLNEARRCLLPGSSETLRRASIQVFSSVDAILQANERVVLAPGLRGEAAKLRDAAARMRKDYATCVQPYLKMAVEFSIGSLDRLEKDRHLENERAAIVHTELVDSCHHDKYGETKTEDEGADETNEVRDQAVPERHASGAPISSYSRDPLEENQKKEGGNSEGLSVRSIVKSD